MTDTPMTSSYGKLNKIAGSRTLVDREIIISSLVNEAMIMRKLFAVDICGDKSGKSWVSLTRITQKTNSPFELYAIFRETTDTYMRELGLSIEQLHWNDEEIDEMVKD